MKTKILFFFLLLVGVGNGFAQSANPDSLLHEIQEARSLLANWDTIPGNDYDKCLTILTGEPIQVEDSIKYLKERSFGVLLLKEVYYTRHIYYDETNKLLKIESKFSQEKMNLPVAFIIFCLHGLLFYLLCLLTYILYSKRPTTSDWMIWCILVSAFIYISYYLGTLCAIISLLYIFKDGIRESIENFLQKRKEKKENKEQD